MKGITADLIRIPSLPLQDRMTPPQKTSQPTTGIAKVAGTGRGTSCGSHTVTSAVHISVPLATVPSNALSAYVSHLVSTARPRTYPRKPVGILVRLACGKERLERPHTRWKASSGWCVRVGVGLQLQQR